MVKRLLTEVSKEIYKTEDIHGALSKYLDMQKHPGWKPHQMFLLMIVNKISELMLSKEFTDLDKETKDTNQRAFRNTKEIIDFLMNPLKGAEQYARILAHNEKVGATKPKRPRKEQ